MFGVGVGWGGFILLLLSKWLVCLKLPDVYVYVCVCVGGGEETK